ncbi:hypothetical protein Tco_0689688 [Tanacetum coccineum]
MPTEMELTLEQTQQGVSYEVSVFTMKMEILLEPTSNKLMVGKIRILQLKSCQEFLLKLNLSDHRLFKDEEEVSLIPLTAQDP